MSDDLECDDCGEPAVHVIEDADDASGYRGARSFCAECFAKRVTHATS